MMAFLQCVLCLALTAWTAAVGAPVSGAGHVDFVRCKNLSVNLSETARELYNKVNITNITATMDNPPPSITPNDSCDPWSLQKSRESCETRIIMALKKYHSIFKKSEIVKPEWSDAASRVTEIVRNLLLELKKSIGEDTEKIQRDVWSSDILFRDIVERLYSFSVVLARVYSFLSSPEVKLPPLHNDTIKQCWNKPK